MRAMLESLRQVLAEDPRVAYALLFGSSARGAASPHSDVDVAIGLAAGVRLSALELGALVSRLEDAAGKPVDLVLLDEAPPRRRGRRDGCNSSAQMPERLPGRHNRCPPDEHGQPPGRPQETELPQSATHAAGMQAPRSVSQ